MKLRSNLLIGLSTILVLVCAGLVQPAGAAQVSTTKKVYQAGEKIVVNFSGAPGYRRDWICIVPKGAPENDGGDYDYTGAGVHKGSMSFEGKPAGEYEARAYFDYASKGYKISARYPFKVVQGKAAAGGKAPSGDLLFMRKLDKSKPLEAKTPAGKGLVYIYREPLFIVSVADVKVDVGGKPLVVVKNNSFYPYVTDPGQVTFSSDTVYDKPAPQGTKERDAITAGRTAKTTVKVKPGMACYLKVRVAPGRPWSVFLDQVPWKDAHQAYSDYKMELLKK